MDQKILTSDVEGLTSLEFTDCEDLECLLDTTKENVPTCAMFNNLEELVMQNMIGLKILCNTQPPDGFLQNLEILRVEKCRDIVSLYPISKNLKKLTVRDGGKLQELFGIDELLYSRQRNQAQVLSNLEYLKLISVPELRWILKGPTRSVGLQNLKFVSVYNCNKLEYLFSFSLIQSLRLLEKLWISDCDKLETIFAESDSDDEAESNKLLPSTQSDIPHLQELQLHGLTNLSSFSLENYFIKAPNLEYLENNCG
ncbi:hypothetical protein PTKIN_Ptkin14bG0128300 [Pterospermum kingtungense]